MRGSSSVPHSARSTNSSATQRTGGTLTARSSDGKGTPRDCERLSLSDLRSGSLQYDDLSARAQRQEYLLQKTPWQGELSRELEIMRFVIVKENEKLKEQLQKLQEECAQLQTELADGNSRPSHGSMEATEDGTHAMDAVHEATVSSSRESPHRWLVPCPEDFERQVSPAGVMVSSASQCPRRRCVEWRITGVDGVKAAAQGQSKRMQFELPELRGATFHMAFGADRSEPRNGGMWSCRLALRLVGNEVDAIACTVALSVHAEVNRIADEAQQTGPPLDLSTAGAVEHVLKGRGEWASCPCAWPSTPSSNVLCKVSFLSFGHISDAVRPIRLVSRNR